MLKAKKRKACKMCGELFTVQRMGHKTCGPSCALKLVREKRSADMVKGWKEDAKVYRREQADKRASVSSKATVGSLRAAEQAVNSFILVRDANEPCIVHGYTCSGDGGWHAGHFQGKGKMPSLRFHTQNIHKQCGVSNSGAHNRKRYKNGIEAMYETNLVERIGRERVEWLKGPQPFKQYKAADFARIADIFKRRKALYTRIREE